MRLCICSLHRCVADRALDVYTKVIRKYPAAVVLHAPKKRHVFMSYDGLFIQRKGRYSPKRRRAENDLRTTKPTKVKL